MLFWSASEWVGYSSERLRALNSGASRFKDNWTGFLMILAVLLDLASLGFSWWGIQIVPAGTSFNWGPYWSLPSSTSQIIEFNPGLIDQRFQVNSSLMIGMVLFSAFLAGLAIFWKRRGVLMSALVASVVTDLIFLGDVSIAIGSNCGGSSSSGETCLSGFVGSGLGGGGSYVVWGFQFGFFLFVASGICSAL